MLIYYRPSKAALGEITIKGMEFIWKMVDYLKKALLYAALWARFCRGQGFILITNKSI